MKEDKEATSRGRIESSKRPLCHTRFICDTSERLKVNARGEGIKHRSSEGIRALCAKHTCQHGKACIGLRGSFQVGNLAGMNDHPPTMMMDTVQDPVELFMAKLMREQPRYISLHPPGYDPRLSPQSGNGHGLSRSKVRRASVETYRILLPVVMCDTPIEMELSTGMDDSRGCWRSAGPEVGIERFQGDLDLFEVGYGSYWSGSGARVRLGTTDEKMRRTTHGGRDLDDQISRSCPDLRRPPTMSNGKANARAAKPTSDTAKSNGRTEEEVVLSTRDRVDVDNLWKLLMDSVNPTTGPVAIRHVHPYHPTSEGLRLVWPSDGMPGIREIEIWHERDRVWEQAFGGMGNMRSRVAISTEWVERMCGFVGNSGFAHIEAIQSNPSSGFEPDHMTGIERDMSTMNGRSRNGYGPQEPAVTMSMDWAPQLEL